MPSQITTGFLRPISQAGRDFPRGPEPREQRWDDLESWHPRRHLTASISRLGGASFPTRCRPYH